MLTFYQKNMIFSSNGSSKRMVNGREAGTGCAFQKIYF